MTQNQLHLKKKEYYWKDHFFGLLFFFSIAIYTFIKYTPDNNAKYLCLIFMILSLIICVFIILNLLSIKNYSITEKELIEWSFLRKEKKVFALNEMESWTEKQLKGKFGNWEQMVLYFKNGEKTKILSDYFENYAELKNVLTKDITRNTEREELNTKKFEKKLAILFLIICFLFFYGAYNALQVEDIKSEDIVVFGDKTSKKIKYIQKKHSSVEIKLEQYPEFIFYISGDALKATSRTALIEDIKKGDSIFIGIDKATYRKEIIRVDSLSTSEKYFPNEYISVESVESKEFHYLELSANNFERSENKYISCFVFALFGFFFILMSIIGFTKKTE
ncbi:hypothetical protein GON26_03290 [Flavobacterium sp. GA093]|uniref:Uncharacterized protein n=1 Tax=Flavobacterium hydrocarbonoxydans TaxID=2683249 RepID=A0A6I4NFP0_9FLAO|nr:hypothetical protein [Flavobacterium hydrocarbonoxydans]MWB93370.1 hypothetical protein [Flavobacterium hydrocarbonoxydans]